jgi:hypothetical protein
MKQSHPDGIEIEKNVVVNSMTPEEYLVHSSNQVDSIVTISDEKSRLLKNIIVELNDHHADISPGVRKKMENSIKMMEVEMLRADQCIINLKKELKDAKTQATNYALMLNESKEFLSRKVNEQGDNGIYFSDADKNSGLAELASLSSKNYLDHEKVLLEIKQLRENNQAQRAIIVKLEHEISLLRDSILGTEDEDVRNVKQQEVNRLERMVKECEGCIEILESEVDHLYTQLQEHTMPNGNSIIETSEDDEIDIVKLGVELEEMAQEMEKMAFQYRQTHSINQLIYDIVKCAAIEEIVTLIIQFFKEFNAPAGFCIISNAGGAEYFPASNFNDTSKELVKSFSIKDPVFYVNEGTLFSGNRVCLMLLPVTDKTKPLSESGLVGLVKVVDKHIQYLESENTLLQRSEGMASWIEATKNHLSDLDIQYAYQVEENTKTFNNFIAEIRQAYHLLDLKGSGLVLLDNAINEYEQRMYVLLSSGDIIDHEISTLITHIDELQIH